MHIKRTKLKRRRHMGERGALIENVPKVLQRGAVEMALVAVELEDDYVPLADVRVERQLTPLEVERADCKGRVGAQHTELRTV